MPKKIILASRSKARAALLRQAGLIFTVVASNAPEETRLNGRPVGRVVVKNALAKAREVAGRHPDAVIIAADTVALAGAKIIGKPRTVGAAARALKTLSRTPQWVYTGLAVIDGASGRTITACEKTKVRMRPLSDAEIRAYFRRVSPLDKAGSFDIQGLGGVFVDRVEGCFYNVVGLPLSRLARILSLLGMNILSP